MNIELSAYSKRPTMDIKKNWNFICEEWHLDSKEIPYGSDSYYALTNPFDTHSYI